jgi:hypothetical protein
VKTVSLEIISYSELEASLDEQARQEIGERERKVRLGETRERMGLRQTYWYVVTTMIENIQGNHVREGRAVLGKFSRSGRQLIADWAVFDMAKPERDQYNWHGQNTSQWSMAGCILVDSGEVSVHT